MPIFKRCLQFVVATVLSATCCAASPLDAAMWQQHQAMIQYFATGTSYSCDGIEDKVRQILQYVGARADMKVRAAGCDQGPFLPSHMASVQGLDYGTSCSPYAAASNSFDVKGAVLKADAGKSG